jgi:hypothetical protein
MNLSVFKNNPFEAGTGFFSELGIKLNSNASTYINAKSWRLKSFCPSDLSL